MRLNLNKINQGSVIDLTGLTQSLEVTGDKDIDYDISLTLNDYTTVYIDDITFTGQLNFKSGADSRHFECHANFKDTDGFGLNHTGDTKGNINRVDYARITGLYNNSGLNCNSGIRHLNLAVEVIDYTGGGLCAPTYIYSKETYEKWHGVWMQYTDYLEGRVKLVGGGAGWFMSMNDVIGSPDNPFTIEDEMLGRVNGEIINVDTIGMNTQTGKIDALQHHGETDIRRYFKLISDGNNKLRYPFLVEATSEAGLSYKTNNIDFELVNQVALKPAFIGVTNDGDIVDNIRLHGTGNIQIIDATNVDISGILVT
jgi:hypothetical protein